METDQGLLRYALVSARVSIHSMPTAKIAVLIKQVTQAESLRFDDEGYQVREPGLLEMDPYCRRAVAIGITLAKRLGATCTAFTLAPPSGEDIIRDAIVAGADAGVLITDRAFAGSDTLATSRALSTALIKTGPFDLIICGRSSTDSDTSQVGPQVAQLLGLAFISNVIDIQINSHTVQCVSQQDDAKLDVSARPPLMFSAAEQLCHAVRINKDARSGVNPATITRLSASALGAGPWGQRGSPTRVAGIRRFNTTRSRTIATGTLVEQCRLGRDFILDALEAASPARGIEETTNWMPLTDAPIKVAVILPPRGNETAKDLCNLASEVARKLMGRVLAFRCEPDGSSRSDPLAIDALIALSGATIPEDAATAIANWLTTNDTTRVVLAPASLWGREVTARIAASLNLGLVGDVIAIEIEAGEVIGLKPVGAIGDIAAISIVSSMKLFTVRSGIFEPVRYAARKPIYSKLKVYPKGRLSITRTYDAINLDSLLDNPAIIGVGTGVNRETFPLMNPFIEALNADVVCTRRVADLGWIPRQRQVGLTGCNIAPAIYVAIGIRGAVNHMIGVQRAKHIFAINSDPNAPIFQSADFGIVGDWKTVIPILTENLKGMYPPRTTKQVPR